jgi:hypothetical protein
MTTERASTGWTAPFFLLRFEEFLHPIFFYICKIFKKAHPEKRLISRINMSEVFTRVLSTFITKPYGMIQKTFTSFFQKSTFFISWPTPSTIWYSNPFTFHIMLHRKVPAAHVAIHSTGGNKFLSKRRHHFSSKPMRLNQLFCHRYNNILNTIHPHLNRGAVSFYYTCLTGA